MYAEDSIFVEDLERNICVAQELMKELSDIFVRIEAFHSDLPKEFGSIYEHQRNIINSCIQDTRKRITEIKVREMRDEKQAKCAGEIEKYEREIREKVALSKSIFDNVCERFSKLEIKCGVDVLELPDGEILNERKEFKIIESDFNNLLDRVVKLSEINPQEFEETKNFLPLISKRKEKLKTLIDLFKMPLEKEIKDRDLSKEKIKNPSILGIKLPRFKGYDSVVDFYTFKVEFEKLVAPWVQAKLLPEYLKNNYLEGQAFEIVKEIDDIDKIWGRLKQSFGNVVILLSTKLKEIESGVPLWQIKSDAKLVQAITKIKNCMMDLSGLAAKHKIEASLFHHSNLAKIYSILGRKR